MYRVFLFGTILDWHESCRGVQVLCHMQVLCQRLSWHGFCMQCVEVSCVFRFWHDSCMGTKVGTGLASGCGRVVMQFLCQVSVRHISDIIVRLFVNILTITWHVPCLFCATCCYASFMPSFQGGVKCPTHGEDCPIHLPSKCLFLLGADLAHGLQYPYA